MLGCEIWSDGHAEATLSSFQLRLFRTCGSRAGTHDPCVEGKSESQGVDAREDFCFILSSSLVADLGGRVAAVHKEARPLSLEQHTGCQHALFTLTFS